MTQTITHMYDDPGTAQTIVRKLKAEGLSDDDISIVSRDTVRRDGDGRHNGGVDPRHDKDHDGMDDRTEGAAAGGTVGGLAGGALGAAAGLGAIAIPGIGPVVAAGWLASTLAGVVAGGAAGGIIGALAGAGTREEDAHVYAEAVRRGGTLVAVRVPDDEAARWRAVMEERAVDVTQRRNVYSSSGWTGYDAEAPAYDAEQIRHERARHL